MINLIVSAPAILILLLAVLCGALRKTLKSAFKLSSVLIAFFLAIPVSAIVVKVAYAPIEKLFYSLMEGRGITKEAISSMPSLAATPEALAMAVARPLVYLVVFLLLLLISLIIYAVLKRAFKDKGEAIPANRVFGALIGAVVAIVIVVGVYTPVFGYVNLVSELEITEDDVASLTDASAGQYLDLLDSVNSTPAVSIPRALGGEKLFDTLSTVKLAKEKAPLKNELSAIAGAVLEADAFIGTDVADYGEAQKSALLGIEESITDSIIIFNVAPELLREASSAWTNGGTFFGLAKPETPELVSSAVDQLLKIFSTSDKENFPADLHTLVGLGGAVIDSEILASIGNNEQLMLALEKDGVVASVVEPLYANERMTPLVREIINIGLRASASLLSIPENKKEVYTSFTDQIATELNAMSTLSAEEMTSELYAKMDQICASFAVDISSTEKQIISMGMAYEFSGRDDIVGTEVSDFFTEYTAYMENSSGDITASIMPKVAVRFIIYTENEEKQDDLLVTTFKNGENVGDFVNKDAKKDENGAIILISPKPEKKSGAAYAATLMKLVKEVEKADENDEQAKEQFKTELLEETLLMSESFENSELFANIIEEKMVEDKTNNKKIDSVLASKPENFPTRIPVIEEILFDESFSPVVKEEGKDEEAGFSASAVAVEKIAKSVSSLVNVLANNENITDNMVAIMEKTGTILDGIAEISKDGEEKATLLTKSIFASDLISARIPVSKSTLIDMAETISAEVAKAREEAKKQEENEDKPAVTTPAITTSPAPVTTAPTTTAGTSVTSAPVTTTNAPVTTAPVNPSNPSGGYENFFGATGQLLADIMIITSDVPNEEKMAVINGMMYNITPTAAKALLHICEPELLMSYGLDESYSNAMAPALNVMFSKLSDGVTNDDRDAVSSLFSLAFTKTAEKNLFLGDGPSTLGMSAYGFVHTIIKSEAVSLAVQKVNLNFSSRASEHDAKKLQEAFEELYAEADESYQRSAINKLSRIFDVSFDK